MDNPELVSIAVPVYNAEPFLEQCLTSLARQTYPHLEILCIDDGSTDNSGAILDDFAERDGRFIVHHRENAGYGSGMNYALRHARGTYFGIVEPDDYVDERMFETLVRAIERAEDIDIARCCYWRVCEATTPNETVIPCYYADQISKVDTPFSLNECTDMLFYHPSIWTGLYRLSFLNQNEISFIEAPGAGWVDNPFFMQTLVSARKIIYVNEALYYYREFSNALAGGMKDPSIISTRWIQMDDILKQNEIDAPAIIEGHMDRGCAHLMMLQQDFKSSDQNAQNEIQRMLPLLDGSIIKHSNKILPEYKRAYKKAIGLFNYMRL